MVRTLRNPLLHFLIIGGGLFLIQAAWQKHAEPPLVFVQEDLVISQRQIEQIKNDVYLQTGTRATREQLKRLVEIEIDDEILYREALSLKLDQNNPSIRYRLVDLARIAEGSDAVSEDILYKRAQELGLDRHDPVVRRLLISNMRLIAKKIPTKQAPAKVDPQELETYYQANKAFLMKSAQVKFTHLYFSRDKRKTKAKIEAELALKKLEAGSAAADLSDSGDVFLGGTEFSYLATSSLEKLFGRGFINALEQAPAGKWTGPLLSSYGWHLVYVQDIRASRPAALPEVANRIKNTILKEREQIRLIQALQKLRMRYKITVEEDIGGPDV